MYGRKATLISTNTLRKKLRFVWFDVMSVPQADAAKQQLAIASIASYVHSSSYFICLAGPWTHATNGSPRDVRAWLTRGWCRTEVTANALSPNQKSVIVVQSPSDVVCHGPGGLMGRNWISALVGQGTFSVDADREPVGGALSGLVDARVARARKAGSVEEVIIARALTATKAHLLQGLGEHAGKVPRPSDLDEFLAQLGFNSVTDGADTGWTPLRLAVMAGRRFRHELLDLGGCRIGSQVYASGRHRSRHDRCTAAIIRDDPEMTRLPSRGANPRLLAGKATSMHFTMLHLRQVQTSTNMTQSSRNCRRRRRLPSSVPCSDQPCRFPHTFVHSDEMLATLLTGVAFARGVSTESVWSAFAGSWTLSQIRMGHRCMVRPSSRSPPVPASRPIQRRSYIFPDAVAVLTRSCVKREC